MRLLAIEAVGSAASVAVVEHRPAGERVLSSAGIDGPGTSDRLLQLVDRVLSDCCRAAAVDTIAVDRGPGGFTAVRTAVAAARALALALDRPILPLTSFEVLASAAASADTGGTVLVVIDGRRGLVSAQTFTGDAEPLGPVRLVPPEEALSGLFGPLAVVGSGRDLVLAACSARRGVEAVETTPDAGTVGLLAARRLRAGLAPAPRFTVQPMYLRPPDARPQGRLTQRPDAAAVDHAGPQT